MIDYTVEVVDAHVVFTLNSINDPSFVSFTSDDGFLVIQRAAGESSGNLCYGRLELWLNDSYLPVTLVSPSYEHQSDVDDLVKRIYDNIGVLNG